MRSYRLPVPRQGTYAVVLYLAETAGTPVGGRVMTIRAEGTTIATGVDLAKLAGDLHAYQVVGTTVVADGVLSLDLVADHGQSAVSAVSVSFVRPGTSGPSSLFIDEFDGAAGAAPDRHRWEASTGTRWAPRELQTYTNRTENAATDGRGNLVIKARRENFAAGDGVVKPFTSARLITQRSFSFTYGHAEARIRMPAGVGLLPAFWMMGDNENTVPWPGNGELDVVELPTPTNIIYGTVHGPDGSPRGYDAQVRGELPTPGYQAFHIYAVDWYPGVVQFSADGSVYGTITEADLAPTRKWTLDHPFYLLFTLAVGGPWPGSPPPDESFPQTMTIDYVRVTG